jgi:hypothetical protein
VIPECACSFHREERAKKRRAMRRLGITLAIGLLTALVAVKVFGQTIRVVTVPSVTKDQPMVILPSRSAFQTLSDQALGLWNVAAQGRIVLVTDIADPYQLTTVRAGCTDTTFESAAAASAVAGGHTGQKWVYYLSDVFCKYGGDAAVGDTSMRITILNASILAHEMGHSLGLWHCFAVHFNGETGNFSEVSLAEYSDPDDVMGGGFYVDAIDLWHLGWFAPPVLDRVPSQTVTIGVGARASVSIRNAIGITYFLEIPTAGATIRVRSNFNGHSWVDVLLPNDVYDDRIGGVRLTATSANTVRIETFVPPTPTPHPFWSPTPVVTYSTALTPTPVKDCWVVEPFVRCSPTPTPVLTAAFTATPPTPTTIPAAATAVPPSIPTTTATATMGGTATPQLAVTPTRTPAPFVPPKAGGGGCSSFTPFSVGVIVASFAAWRRRLSRALNTNTTLASRRIS